jgi:hypothetical protein
MIGSATSESFNKLYEENLIITLSYREAYELTEDQHVKEFGQRKYSSYQSFKVVRCKLKNS